MNKRIEGIRNSLPSKRYKTFITVAADREQVFVHKGAEWSVWPEKPFISPSYAEETIECLDVHAFCAELDKNENSLRKISVFPTEANTTIVESKALLSDLLEELNRIE